MALFPFSWFTSKSTDKRNPPHSSSPSRVVKVVSTQRKGTGEKIKEESSAARKTVAEGSLKVTDTAELERHLQIEGVPTGRALELFCPIRKAKVYCHSILVDKLGELTRFIVSSLHEGHSIEEINDLTKMGEITVKEEVDYLVRGGLIDASGANLTSLGHQYGELLAVFNDLSDGIEVSFNEFAILFEPPEPECVQAPKEEFILRASWIPALSKNDNYANSLAIALNHINADIPFCSEIRDSLYATVWISNETAGYKRLRVRDYGIGAEYSNKPYVGVAVPFVRVTCKPRYSWVDPYRKEIEAIRNIEEEHVEQLLTSLARDLLVAASEEDSADALIIDVDETTGTIHKLSNGPREIPEAGGLIRLEGNPSLRAVVDPSACKGILLEEAGREELYQVTLVSYEEMEAC